MALWRATPFCAARSPIDWARSTVEIQFRVSARRGHGLAVGFRGSACFGNAKQAEFTRKNGFNIDQTGCEKANVNAATITRQSKSNLALAFVSLGRERKRDITIFYAFCRVVDDIADSAGPERHRETSASGELAPDASRRRSGRAAARPRCAAIDAQIFAASQTCSRKLLPAWKWI